MTFINLYVLTPLTSETTRSLLLEQFIKLFFSDSWLNRRRLVSLLFVRAEMINIILSLTPRVL